MHFSSSQLVFQKSIIMLSFSPIVIFQEVLPPEFYMHFLSPPCYLKCNLKNRTKYGYSSFLYWGEITLSSLFLTLLFQNILKFFLNCNKTLQFQYYLHCLYVLALWTYIITLILQHLRSFNSHNSTRHS